MPPRRSSVAIHALAFADLVSLQRPGVALFLQLRRSVDGLLGRTSALIERYMDLLAARQRVTAGNIANADTPGYRTRDIDFRAALQSYLNSAGAPQPYPMVVVRESFGEGAKNDGNNVDLDQEMQKLAENVMHFTTASTLLQKEIQEVRSAIREGK